MAYFCIPQPTIPTSPLKNITWVNGTADPVSTLLLAHDPLEYGWRKLVHEAVFGHGDVLFEADLAVKVYVARGQEAVDDVLELRLVKVERVQVGRDPARFDQLTSRQMVVVVSVHQHERDLFRVPRVVAVQTRGEKGMFEKGDEFFLNMWLPHLINSSISMALSPLESACATSDSMAVW
jgi:hypothetical protein